MNLSPIKRSLASGLAVLISIYTTQATDQIYINSGHVTTAPQIDAFAFLNEGVFDINTTYPFETSNTRNYTNNGVMVGSPGWRFETYPSSGPRKRAEYFVNEGTISGRDSGFSSIVFNGTFLFPTLSYLLVNSTNIISRGPLSVGPNGIIKLEANSANLRGAALLAADSADTTFFSAFDSFTSTNFVNESKIVERYWGVGTNGVMSGEGSGLNLSQFAIASAPRSGSHEVAQLFSSFVFTNTTSVPNSFFALTNGNFAAYAYTNPTFVNSGVTGQVIQVVFVSTNSLETNMSVNVRFSPNGNPSRGSHAMVQFAVPDTDVITALPFTNFLYFGDNSVAATSGTNSLFLQENRSTIGFRPNPYDVTFRTPFNWFGAAVSNITYRTDLLYDPVNLSTTVTNLYSGYSVAIGLNAATNANISAAQADPTNSVGRIEVLADQLNLNLARVRSEGLLTLRTTNFTALTEGAKLDAQLVNLTLASTNRSLVISNMLAGNVRRITGQLDAWSGIWTNVTFNGEQNVYHVLILDNKLSSTLTTTAYGFTMRATNQLDGLVVLADPITVSRNFLIDADHLWVRSNLTVAADLGATNWPRLLTLTNEGFINIPGNAVFSRVSGVPFDSFVNRRVGTNESTGVIVANGQNLNTKYFENRGILATRSGSITINNQLGNSDFADGQILSSIDVTLITEELRTSNSVVIAGYNPTNSGVQINGSLSVTSDRLVEHGTNFWNCFNGFKLFKKTPGVWQGDFMKTILRSTVRPLTVVRHYWAAQDRGVSNDGFTNNAAVGYLVLDGGNSCRFRFSAADPGEIQAIYVDYLDLQNFATNFQTALEIDSNFRIYFAGSSVPPEKLDNTHGGRLRWVKSFAGPNSSVEVLINGELVKVNKALYESKEIDSDGDGIPNAFDPSPFDGVVLSQTFISPATISLSWNAAANTTYYIDYATDLNASNSGWNLLRTVSTGPNNEVVTIQESVVGEPRYYRVHYKP